MKPVLPCGMAAFLCLCATGPEGWASERDVVINEIMYHPPLDREDLQYVELHNRGPSAVDVAGWRLTKGIQFVFPENSHLAPGAFLVVCRNKAAFIRHYGEGLAVVGDFSGKLSHKGEEVELRNARADVVESVRYTDHEPWPTGPDGYSASLERICPSVSGQEAWNWAGSLLPEMEEPAGTPGRTNDTYSSRLPPIVSKVQFRPPAPGERIAVMADVAAVEGVKSVTLLWQVPRRGMETPETEIPMRRTGGDGRTGTYEAILEGQAEGTLVRFRIRAEDEAGVIRLQPALNEPRPTYSFAACANTNTARVALAYVLNFAARRPEIRGPRRPRPQAEPARGQSAFIYVPPDGGEVLVFDHVIVRSRPGGFKVHFQRDRPFQGMTGINLIFEGWPRRVLAEPLAFELYRLAGVPAPLTEHVRVWRDGRLTGYELLIEQPNKSFLTRHQRDDSGHLYKLIWQGHGIVGQHEKKTRVTERHDDLVRVIQELNQKSGNAQWDYIRRHFNVEEFINYYAVNMLIQNWDGFFNNYFTYHDTGDTGKWEIYPWDEDKTWGDYDGASPNYDWYEMPLTMGMRGDRPAGGGVFGGRFGGGPHGGANWWRRPGWFSGPLLANPEFRRRFLERLRDLCQNVFTEERFIPIIDALEKRLEPEVAVRARTSGQDTSHALGSFHRDIQSFRNQVKHRRQFILKQLGQSGVRHRNAVVRVFLPWVGLAGGAAVVGAVLLLVVWRLCRPRRIEPPPFLSPPAPPPVLSAVPPVLPPLPSKARPGRRL